MPCYVHVKLSLGECPYLEAGERLEGISGQPELRTHPKYHYGTFIAFVTLYYLWPITLFFIVSSV